MEVIIRNIDRNIVKKIDNLAREQGFSRNHYLRQTLEQLPYIRKLESIENEYINIINDLEKKYISIINDLKDIVRENTIAYKEVLELAKDLKGLKEFNKIKTK